MGLQRQRILDRLMTEWKIAAVLLTAFTPMPALAQNQTTARGVVFHDQNRNGKREKDEPALANVPVSNGYDVVLTDDKGRYALTINNQDAVVFVIKPRGYRPPSNHYNLPQFHYVHKPTGSPPGLKYPGVTPTGRLPSSVDFPLYKQSEPNEFKVVIFGDPQPNNLSDIDHMANDVISEQIGTDAAFGLALGDLMADRLDLYTPYNRVMSQLGIPLWNVPGNHDLNMDVPNDAMSNETWKRIFGPTTYSFDYGSVHFIVLDNILWRGNSYSVGFDKQTLEFVENDLEHVPREKLVVIAMHAPLFTVNSKDLLVLLKNRPHTLSFSGHHHDIEQRFMGQQDGWPNAGAHHHINAGAICGIHWLGQPDEFGIPHAMTHCGSPNGYPVVTFKDNQYSIRFHAPRRSPNDQMHVFVPNEILLGASHDTTVLANIYWGTEKSNVTFRINHGDWRPMERSPQQDPYLKKVITPGHPLSIVTHMWSAQLPADLPAGGHTIEVRTVDMYGQTFFGRRIVRVVTSEQLATRERAKTSAAQESGLSLWQGKSGRWTASQNWSAAPAGRSVLLHGTAVVTLSKETTVNRFQLADGATLVIGKSGSLISTAQTNYVGSGYLGDANGGGHLKINDTGRLSTRFSISLGDRDAAPGKLTLLGSSQASIGGGLYVGVRSDARITMDNKTRCVVDGPVQLGWGADLGFHPSSIVEMRGGLLEARSITATRHCQPVFLFSGGNIVLHGDQRNLANQEWFWTSRRKQIDIQFDAKSNRTTFAYVVSRK